MTAKTAHKKIYQVAKEINISHETLIEYLTKRGHAVKAMDPWGSVQAVSVDPASGLARGGSDSRSPGVAAGP